MDKCNSERIICGIHVRIQELLGKGKGGYSYLVTDGESRYVLKLIHHEPCEYYSFGDKFAAEMGDYEKLKSLIRIPRLIAFDRQQEAILKEYIPGNTIKELLDKGESVVEYIGEVRQMSEALRKNNLNIDYYPTNFVPYNGLLYYIDYECNLYDERWSFESWGINYWNGGQC